MGQRLATLLFLPAQVERLQAFAPVSSRTLGEFYSALGRGGGMRDDPQSGGNF
jgi:hypothetical protein